jgi:[ribosomal protein S5]-alanine N-acetyltransferase
MTDAQPSLTTLRLSLRPLVLADADAVQACFPCWDIVRFLNSRIPWPYPPDGAVTFIRDIALPAMQQGTQWNWSIRPKTNPDRLIGVITLRDGAEDNRGFWLDPAWQGQGLMSEAAEAVTEYWFETLYRPVLRVLKAVANDRSRRVSERQGMRLVGIVEREFVSGRLPTEVWELTRDEWRKRPTRKI